LRFAERFQMPHPNIKKLWTATGISTNLISAALNPAPTNWVTGKTGFGLAAGITELELTEARPAMLRIAANPEAAGYRVTLINVTDQQGRRVPIAGASWSTGFSEYELRSLVGAQSLNVTFALHKSRFVTFMAKPEMKEANLRPGDR
jgi:hypothetical protein